MIKPILFSTSMVQAILSGNKTQTRRIAKAPEYAEKRQGGLVWYDPMQNQETKRIPKYQPSDILWVRETWSDYCLDCKTFTRKGYLYKADSHRSCQECVIKWRPSIHMPRAASRIFLRVTDVRAERVQDISEADAISEGCEGVPCDHSLGRYTCEDCMNSGWREPPQLDFMWLWDSINAKRGFGWDTNCWVWVYTFEHCEKPDGWPK